MREGQYPPHITAHMVLVHLPLSSTAIAVVRCLNRPLLHLMSTRVLNNAVVETASHVAAGETWWRVWVGHDTGEVGLAGEVATAASTHYAWDRHAVGANVVVAGVAPLVGKEAGAQAEGWYDS